MRGLTRASRVWWFATVAALFVGGACMVAGFASWGSPIGAVVWVAAGVNACVFMCLAKFDFGERCAKAIRCGTVEDRTGYVRRRRFRCERVKGHDGNHLAHITDRVTETWPRRTR